MEISITKNKKITQGILVPLFLFAVVQLIYHILMKEPASSDASWFFRNQLDVYSLKDYLYMRYETWSSRLLIEAVLVWISRHMLLWRIFDWGFWMLLFWSCVTLFPEQMQKKAANIFLVALLIYPLYDLGTAGWVATSVNYTWPVALGILSLHGTAAVCRKETVTWWQWLIYVPSALFGANMEQMCAVLLAVNGCAVLWLLLNRYPYQSLVFPGGGIVIAAAEFLFIMTCPGNAARKTQEIINWMPNFSGYNLIDKISLAFTDTMHHLVASENSMFLCYAILLAVLAWLKTEDVPARAAAVFPAAVNLLLVGMAGTLKTYYPSFWKLMKKSAWINAKNYYQMQQYLPTILYLLVIGGMIVAVVCICESRQELAAQMILLALALATRLVMGFTPTIYVSQERTFFFLYVLLAISAAGFILANEKLFAQHKKVAGAAKTGAVVLSVLQIFVILSNFTLT